MKSNTQWRELAAGDMRFPCNPFATRFVSPGCLEWISSSDNSVAALAARFKSEHGQQAAIVGPHGSGKTTLLAQLVPLLGEVSWRQAPDNQGAIVNADGKIVWLGLRRGSHRPLHQIMVTRKYWSHHGLLVLDGLEQLRPWETVCMRAMQRAARMGLLATCHRRYRMPYLRLTTLTSTTADVQVAQRLVAERLSSSIGFSPSLKEELTQIELIERLLEEEQGSVREVFMRLYDLVENRRAPSRLSNWRPASVSRINDIASRK